MFAYAANNPVRYIDPNGRFNAVDDTIKGFTLWFNAFSNPTNFNTLNEVSDFMNATPEFWLYALIGGITAGEYAFCYTSEDFRITLGKLKTNFNLIDDFLKSKGFYILERSYIYKFDSGQIKLDFSSTSISLSDFNFAANNRALLPINETIAFVAELNFAAKVIFSNIKESSLDIFEIKFSLQLNY